MSRTNINNFSGMTRGQGKQIIELLTEIRDGQRELAQATKPHRIVTEMGTEGSNPEMLKLIEARKQLTASILELLNIKTKDLPDDYALKSLFLEAEIKRQIVENPEAIRKIEEEIEDFNRILELTLGTRPSELAIQ